MDLDPTKPFHLPRSFTYNNKPLWAHLADHNNDSSLLRHRPSPSPSPSPTVILYTTSLRSIRRTYEDCCSLRNILHGFRVAVDERDVSMDSSYRRELQSLLLARAVTDGVSTKVASSAAFSLPQLFVGGKLVGGVEKVRQMHEDGELRKVLEGVERVDPCFVCRVCGGARFMPCRECRGSRKVFDEEGKVRRCGQCNENGLVRCPSCCVDQSVSKPNSN